MAKETRNVRREYLALDDAALLAQCDVDVYKSSGPGGQHRNKVSSAVRLRHRPTGVRAQGEESRSQHENKARALRRLRMKIACGVRKPVDRRPDGNPRIPPVVTECIFTPRGRGQKAAKRLEVGRKDRRFWQIAAFLLDMLDATGAKLSDCAAAVGINTSNLVSVLKSDRHLLAAVQEIRKAHSLKTIS